MTRTVDTRFFLRHFTADTPDLKAKTSRKMRELQGEQAAMPTIVIHELHRYQYQSLGRDIAETRTNLIVRSGFHVVNPDVAIAKKAGELRSVYAQLPTADAIIAATALVSRSSKVVRDDPHFRAIKEIRTEWV